MSLQAQQRDFAFCILARHNPIRRVVIAIVENPWFNRLVLSIIIANCIFLAIANPLCDTEVEIRSNPACAANPAKWQSVSPQTKIPAAMSSSHRCQSQQLMPDCCMVGSWKQFKSSICHNSGQIANLPMLVGPRMLAEPLVLLTHAEQFQYHDRSP